MPAAERRKRRSDKTHLAVSHYLETLRTKRGLDAVALATEEGFFIAGAGDVDLEWMGALGASSRLRELEWDDHTLHVHPFEVNALTLYLVAAGKAVRDEIALKGIRRILA
ncbi:MAG: hypothetical protein QM723_32760 [Myxococcaceae bacterium]